MTIAQVPPPSVFTGVLAGFAGRLAWCGLPPGDAVPLMAEGLQPHLRHYHESVGGGPFVAACSLWAQVYANGLLIPAVCLVAEGAMPACRAGAVTASFCPRSGHAERFLIHAGRSDADQAVAVCSLVRLLDAHLDGLADALQQSSGLSPRVTWENIGGTLAWAVREVARTDTRRGERLLLLAKRLPLRSELGARLRRAFVEEPRQRRTCCLRYRVPGVPACPDICPRRSASLGLGQGQPAGGGGSVAA